MLLEIMLKDVQVHTSIMEMQRVCTSGTFALDSAAQVKFCDQYIEAISKVCAGQRGEAFVAAREIGFDNLCEIVDGRPCAIDTLISNICEEWFSLQVSMNLKNCSVSTVALEDTCPDKMERV